MKMSLRFSLVRFLSMGQLLTVATEESLGSSHKINDRLCSSVGRRTSRASYGPWQLLKSAGCPTLLSVFLWVGVLSQPLFNLWT